MAKLDQKPPRFMVVLKDFQTDVQIQVGAPKMKDFLKPLTGLDLKKNERFELERVIRYFEKKVKEVEKPMGKRSKNATIGELVKPQTNLTNQFKRK